MSSHDIRRRFDRAGAGYESVAVVQARVAEELAGRCPEHLSGRVLEIGAGSGLLTRLLAPRLLAAGQSDSLYVALDLSPGMLAHAAMPPGVVRLAANGEEAPLVPGSFDFLASASAMHWYADPARSLAANLRLLRPGGRFALAFYLEGTLSELDEASRATGFGSVYPMRPEGWWRETLAAMPGIVWEMEAARHTVVHADVREMLRSLQGAGVTHTPSKRVGSPGKYREFVRYYQSRFARDGGVAAGYVVAMATGRATRPGRAAFRPRG